jgi:hypothetical protein
MGGFGSWKVSKEGMDYDIFWYFMVFMASTK